MRGDSVEVTFSGEIRGADREDIFRVTREVAEAYQRHRVVPAGESAVVIRHDDPPPAWWFLISWLAFLVGDRQDTLIVNTRATQRGTFVDIVGTAVEQVADELADALDALSAGSMR